MSGELRIPAFTMLPGAGPACEGEDCLPVPAGAPQQADPASAGS
jgi:hypothetical protein